MKNMLKKSIDSQSDFKLALLIYRNSPLKCGFSPSQLFFNRRLRDNLPVAKQLLSPESKLYRNFRKEKQNQKKYFDRGTKVLPTLKPGMPVRLLDTDSKTWCRKGKIVKLVAPRSYLVDCDNGGVYRRNRGHLRVDKTLEPNGSSPKNSNIRGTVTTSVRQKRERRARARLITEL